jgi:hypothetical protein
MSDNQTDLKKTYSDFVDNMRILAKNSESDNPKFQNLCISYITSLLNMLKGNILPNMKEAYYTFQENLKAEVDDSLILISYDDYMNLFYEIREGTKLQKKINKKVLDNVFNISIQHSINILENHK